MFKIETLTADGWSDDPSFLGFGASQDDNHWPSQAAALAACVELGAVLDPTRLRVTPVEPSFKIESRLQGGRIWDWNDLAGPGCLMQFYNESAALKKCDQLALLTGWPRCDMRVVPIHEDPPRLSAAQAALLLDLGDINQEQFYRLLKEANA
jgi:hypothetical protein